jgi:RNA polymerase sigma-70 factor (ECF subfamily)
MHMTLLTELSDDALLRRTISGDDQAFTTLYRRRQVGIYRFVLHMTGNPALAEEVTQDTFMALIRDPASYDSGKGSLAGWLFGVARNQVLKQIERNRPYVPLDDDTDTGVLATQENPLGDLTRAEAIESVRQAVLTLPAVYREAVVMCDLEEMSYADAADVLGVPVGTVRSRLSRGRTMLLEKLQAGKRSMRCFV